MGGNILINTISNFYLLIEIYSILNYLMRRGGMFGIDLKWILRFYSRGVVLTFPAVQ
jgi:hypothetical protein